MGVCLILSIKATIKLEFALVNNIMFRIHIYYYYYYLFHKTAASFRHLPGYNTIRIKFQCHREGTLLTDDVGRGNPRMKICFVKVNSILSRKADTTNVTAVLEPVMQSEVLMCIKA